MKKMELKLNIKKPEFSFEKIKQVDYRGFIRYYSCHSPIDYHLQVGTRIAMMNALDAIKVRYGLETKLLQQKMVVPNYDK